MVSLSNHEDQLASAVGQRLIFGQPRGLVFIAATELWDRISFHGMQALLVLYMIEQLLLPGHIERIAGFAHLRAIVEFVTGPLSTQALATQIFGVYVGLVYFTPVLGGVLGDRLLGRIRAVSLGALLMTAGHFCMAFDESFLLALLFLILGAGLLRGNLAPQLGELYAPDDRRRTFAFQIYGSAINLGAFIAPLATGALRQAYGWHTGFAFAGFGMLFGLCIYLAGRRNLPKEAPRGPTSARREPLTRSERRAVQFLLLLVPVASLFWIAQSQVWNLQSLGARSRRAALRPLDDAGAVAAIARRPLAVPVPAAFARVLTLAGIARTRTERTHKDGDRLFPLCGFDLLARLRRAFCVAGRTRAPPVDGGLSLRLEYRLALFLADRGCAVFTLSPTQRDATMIGAYYLSVFLGSVISGRLGALYERLTAFELWSMHAALCTLGGAVLLVIGSVRTRAVPVAQQTAFAQHESN